MSLLNQVLQDLEHGKVAKSAGSNTIFDQIKASTPTKSTALVSFSLIVIVLILLSFLVYKLTLAPTKIEHVQPILSASEPLQSDVLHTEIAAVPDSADTQAVEKSAIKIKHIDADILPATKPNEVIIKKEVIIQKTMPIETVTNIINEAKPIKKKKVIKAKPQITEPKKIIKITTLSPKQKADRLFSEAQKSLSLSNKHDLLQNVLALNSGHIEAHLLIAHTYLRQGLMNNAIQSLEASLQLIPNNIAFTSSLAGLLLKDKQPKKALNHLLNINSNTVKSERFLTLIAAAYQQNKLVVKASESYEKLLNLNPDKAEYWLGLAVALESQKRNNDALIAYRKALALNNLKPAVISYIKQRINSIN